jgi:hypothetical protein
MRSRSHGLPVLLLGFLLCAALPAPGHAADVLASPAPGVASTVKPGAMMTEIRTLLADEHRSLAALNERFRRTTDQAAAITLQREIAQLKLGTEIALLRVQARYARAEGRLSVAAHLENAVRELESPPVPRQSAVRPSPTSTETTTAPNAQR